MMKERNKERKKVRKKSDWVKMFTKARLAIEREPRRDMQVTVATLPSVRRLPWVICLLPDQSIKPKSHALGWPLRPGNPVCISIPGVRVDIADFAIVCLPFAGKSPVSAPAVIPRPLVVAILAGLPCIELVARDPSFFVILYVDPAAVGHTLRVVAGESPLQTWAVIR